MEETENPSLDPSVAAFAAALRIFAARGRAIREERARKETPASDQSARDETVGADSKRLTDLRGNLLEESEEPSSD